MNELESNKLSFKNDKDVAFCVITPEGYIQMCSKKAIEIYGYNSENEVEGLHVKQVFPDDFSDVFPEKISEEHLTNGKYVHRVHRKKNGELFVVLFRLGVCNYNGKNCVVAEMKPFEPGSNEEITEILFNQKVDILKHELKREKNLRIKMEGELHAHHRKQIHVNTYTDFDLVSKISKKYQKLTPGDLRLCSLLFLNLSSKEIADALNISTEGVFAARKRLRKKLNLKKDETLVQFIYEQFSKN